MNFAPLLRLLQPSTNGNGLFAVGAAVYAIIQVVVYHQPVGDPQVYLAGIAAIAALYNRSQNTPVSDPRLPAMHAFSPSEVHITTQNVKLTSAPSGTVQSGGVITR